MQIRTVALVSVVVISLLAPVMNAKDKPAARTSAIQKKNGDLWIDSSFDALKENLANGDEIELRLRGWLSRIELPSSERGEIWMLDVGEISWLLDLQDDAKLRKTADGFKRQQVIVSGLSKMEPIGLNVESWLPGLSIQSLARARPGEPGAYIAELESQVERLYDRLDQFAKLARDREIDVQPPAASKAVPLNVESIPIVVNLQKDEMIVIEKKQLTLEQLEATLKRAVENDPSQSVVIRSDRGVPFRQLTVVLDVCKKAGIRDVSVAVASPE